MVNCLEDRDLDALYKTQTSEAVYGLGVANVRWQIAATAAACLWLGGWLALEVGAWVGAWVLAGLAVGWAYSAGPRLKGRGMWQIPTLWALIFCGPMVLVAAACGAVGPRQLLTFAMFGVLQQGIVLVNTAEDLREDRELGVYTSAIALGAAGSLQLAALMIGAGGAALLPLLALAGADHPLALLPLVVGWGWALIGVGREAMKTGGEAEGEERCRRLAPSVPIWLAVVAWGALWAAGWARWG